MDGQNSPNFRPALQIGQLVAGVKQGPAPTWFARVVTRVPLPDSGDVTIAASAKNTDVPAAYYGQQGPHLLQMRYVSTAAGKGQLVIHVPPSITGYATPNKNFEVLPDTGSLWDPSNTSAFPPATEYWVASNDKVTFDNNDSANDATVRFGGYHYLLAGVGASVAGEDVLPQWPYVDPEDGLVKLVRPQDVPLVFLHRLENFAGLVPLYQGA